jgi:hypothetical protein
MPVGIKEYGSEYPIYLAGLTRSAKWPTVRKRHLKTHPGCEICGATALRSVHHIQPFHLFPELELDPTNLITLCEGSTVNCHYLFGHFMDWKNYNPDVAADAKRFSAVVKQRLRQG